MVQLFDAAGRHLEDLVGFKSPSAALALAGGAILVAEAATGRLIHVRGAHRSVLADGMDRPAALARLTPDAVVVAEAGGRLTRIATGDGSRRELRCVSGSVRSIAVTTDGRLIALDVEHRRMVCIDLADGSELTIASNLPVGHLKNPYPRSGGIAAALDGSIYVAADRDNSILRFSQ